MSNIQKHALIDKQIQAYVDTDLDEFLTFFSPEVKFTKNGGEFFKNHDEFLNYYRESFRANVGHKVEILDRMIFNNYVVDHERVSGRAAGQILEAIVIYTIQEDKIVAVDFKF